MTSSELAPPMSGPLLIVRDIVAGYGPVTALHGVSIEAAPGAVTAIIGPNGAGKTTLLRTIAGLHRPSGGTVTFAGEPLGRLPAHQVARRGLALVPEGRGVIAPLSVEENLLVGAQKTPAARTSELIEQQLALFPALERRLHTAAGLLSGGEQQMLAIARGLMSSPRLIAIDEPSMGLAPVVVRDVLDALTATRSTGVAVLLVEQNVALARQLADNLYVLAGGEIVAAGPPDRLPDDLMAAYLN